MKRIAVLLAGFVTATLVTAAPAQADEWGPWNITDPGAVCVRADFPVTGSGWKVQKAVANWNSVQTDVRFVMGYNESCSDILVHRYADQDQRCGYAHHQRLWDQTYVANGVVYVAGADVFLNDNCSRARAMRKYVIAHELGHAIGLVHTDAVDSVMSHAYLARTYKGVPGATDVSNITALYSQ